MSSHRVAVVTGASRGIGAATALELARRGYDVAVVARTEPALREVADSAVALGGRAIVISGDLADVAFGESVIERVAAEFGRIDVLVNNAAWRELVTLRTISLESWERTLRICLTVPAFMSRAAAVHMERQGNGVIVNISSIQSNRASGFASPYVAAKGAIEALTYDLATLYGRRGIRAVAVRPGAIETELSADYTDASGDSINDRTRANAEDMIPLRRRGVPEEVAHAIAWLASDEASYVTGTAFTVDGGWSTQISPYSTKQLMFPDEFSE